MLLSLVLPLNDEIVVQASEIYGVLKKQGAIIGDADILIAATALVHDLALVTRPSSLQPHPQAPVRDLAFSRPPNGLEALHPPHLLARAVEVPGALHHRLQEPFAVLGRDQQRRPPS